ncbi:hypothetical protein METP2_01751 [Methanosarcinales archaeon]|nr:hypothetical protein METP2_01751 [Methanosarcinales archaeon]
MVSMGQDRFNLATNRYPLDDFEGFTPNEMHGNFVENFVIWIFWKKIKLHHKLPICYFFRSE